MQRIANLPYLILLAISIGLLLLHKHVDDKSKGKIEIIISFCLIIFSGFRYMVGKDYYNYAYQFKKISQDFTSFSDSEIGHRVLIKICSSLGFNSQMMFLLYAIFTILLIARFIRLQSNDIELSWMLFICIGPFYLSTFNGMRQWLAVALFANALIELSNKNFRKYALLILIATLFHYSSIIMIGFYFIVKREKFGITHVVSIYVLIQILCFTGIMGFLMNMLHANEFYDSDRSTKMDSTYLLFLGISILCWLYSRIMCNPDENSIAYYNLNLLSGLMVFCALTPSPISNIVFTRINLFFFIGYIVLIPKIICDLKPEKYRVLIKSGMLFLSIAYYYKLTSSNDTMIPYIMNFNLLK